MMYETLPCYLHATSSREISQVLQRSPQNSSSNFLYRLILLYDLPSHLREQINHTYQLRMFFCSFLCIQGNNPKAVSVWGKWLHTKKSFPVGKRYLPMVKRASVTTANATLVDGTLSKKSQWCYKV